MHSWGSTWQVSYAPITFLKITLEWSINLQTIWRWVVDKVLMNNLLQIFPIVAFVREISPKWSGGLVCYGHEWVKKSTSVHEKPQNTSLKNWNIQHSDIIMWHMNFFVLKNEKRTLTLFIVILWSRYLDHKNTASCFWDLVDLINKKTRINRIPHGDLVCQPWIPLWLKIILQIE